MSATIINGDCLEQLKKLPARSVDCFICDLPYGQLSKSVIQVDITYRGGKIENKTASACPWDVKLDLSALWTEIKRLCKDDHTPVLMFCNTKFGFELYNSNPDWFRYDLVWNKERGVSFLLANKQPMKSHEMIYLFSKKGAYYKRVDIKGEFTKWKEHNHSAKTRIVETASGRNIAKANDGTTRCPLSVITVRKPNTLGHPTEKPLELYTWLLERYCIPGGHVVDPTAGSFNSIIAAKQLGLHGIGIEKDIKFFNKAIQKIINYKIPIIESNQPVNESEHVEKVLNYIKEHLTPKSAERHKYGEVFTPMKLVNEMLDTLPSEVWKNKNLKWLDPANGMGNYPIAVFLRLFYGYTTKEGKYMDITNRGAGEAGVDYNPGLTKVIPNEDLRRKHIVRDMLYMVELNSKNNAIAKNLFNKLAPGIEPNIIQMHRTNGFLADVEMKFPNGIVGEFDIVMGNPPYQSGAVKSVGTSVTRRMRKETGLTTDLNKNLWIPFTKKAINILNKSGYLLFIHPIGWFKPDGLKPQVELHNLMLSKQILKLRIYKNSQAGKLFGGFGAISMAYYLLENNNVSKATDITNILDKQETVLLSEKSVIILAYNSILSKIIHKGRILNNTDDFKQKALTKKDCNDDGKYKNIQKIAEDGNIIIIKSDKKMEYLETPKIYIDGINYPRFYYDKNGEYGIIDQNQFYIIGNNLNKQSDYFKTNLSALLLKYIKYRQDFIEPRYYPDVRTLPIEKITDETLADYFGFTKEERDAINATEYPQREYKFKEITCAQLKGEKAIIESNEPVNELQY
jgi:DNA modification methylase